MMCQEHNSLHGGDGAVEEHRSSSWLREEVPGQDGLQEADQVGERQMSFKLLTLVVLQDEHADRQRGEGVVHHHLVCLDQVLN